MVSYECFRVDVQEATGTRLELGSRHYMLRNLLGHYVCGSMSFVLLCRWTRKT